MHIGLFKFEGGEAKLKQGAQGMNVKLQGLTKSYMYMYVQINYFLGMDGV